MNLLYIQTQYCTQVGEFALHAALQRGHKDIVQILLEANTDSDLQEVSHVYNKQKYHSTVLY